MLLATSLVLAAAAHVSFAGDDAIHLTLVPKGGMGKIGYYAPQRVNLSTDKPAGITKTPEGLTAAQYGTMPVAGGFLFILDEPDGKPSKLYVDSNHNGDLTDDSPAEWKGKESTQDGKTTVMYNGGAMVDIGETGKPLLVNVAMYRFDRNDPAREALKAVVLFYRDYAYEGEITIGGKKLKAVLSDEKAKGDFRAKQAKSDAKTEDDASGVMLLVDVNGNGKFDSRGESFDVAKPFNIGGTTWEIANMARDGSSFSVVKSTQTVQEVSTPPDHRTGQAITAFEAKDTDGKTVNFPKDYSGKIVLLDFWATWCQPCMKEMPNVVAAYAKYHDAGFEILGVSLDNEKSIARMPEVMTNAKMTWRQVADGKGWKAAIAQTYVVNSIPATFLVDGTTGKVIGMDLRGEALDKAIEKALASKSKTKS